MKEKLEKEILDRMFENNLKMKKIRASYTTLLFMSAAMLALQCVMFVLGALNVCMLEGIFMSFIVFFCGTQKYNKFTLLYVLTGINILAGSAFIVFHPVSEMLFRLGVMQHFYLALESYLYVRLGGQKEELSYELGYPYFTELAEYQMQEKEYEPEYIPENPQTSGYSEMDDISDNEDSQVLMRSDRGSDYAAMEEIDLNNSSEADFSASLRFEEYNSFREYYNKDPEEKYKEIEYDKALLRENRSRKNRFDFLQKILFIADVILLLISISNIGNIYKNPLEIFKLFPVVSVIAVSVITVTCLEKRELIKYSAAGAAGLGLQFALATFDGTYLCEFFPLALQLFICLKLADEQEYLKTQFGYPYFKENMIKNQYSKYEYVPEHRLNFENRDMDKI